MDRVWESGRMKKSDYRKFIIRTVEGNDDFASMREVISRDVTPTPSEGRRMRTRLTWPLVLVDGGLGQLHAAAEALERTWHHGSAPLASIAKARGMDLCVWPGKRAGRAR